MKTLLLLLLPVCLFAQPTVDQSSISSRQAYTGGTSARTLPGYAFGQSFTAGRTGTLTAITMGFFGTINGTVTLRIYNGNRPDTSPFQTLIVPVMSVAYGPGGATIPVNFNTWTGLNVPLIAGQQYCFIITPNANISDPYGIPTGAGYSGGQGLLIDAPAEDPAKQSFYDFGNVLFQTWVL